MTRLETYHDAGLLEILQTSTMPVELSLAPQQAQKAKKYGVIGGSTFFIQGDRGAQSMSGAGVNKSQMPGLMDRIFGTGLNGHALKRALRDVLHLDQAHQNDADIFVTNDRRLLEAQNLPLNSLSWQVKFIANSSTLPWPPSRISKFHKYSIFALLMGCEGAEGKCRRCDLPRRMLESERRGSAFWRLILSGVVLSSPTAGHSELWQN